MDKKTAYIRFMAPVTPDTASALMRAIDTKICEGVERLHLLISSPGGSVTHGQALYNFLRGAPIEVCTHNFGSVDSIGVVIFCAGDDRLSVPHARFLIHGVSLQVSAGSSWDEPAIEELLKGLKIDYQNIARVIADTTGRLLEHVVKDMNDRITLNPEESVKYGLVQRVESRLFPAGADLFVVGENIATQLPIPTGMGAIAQSSFIDHVSTPPAVTVTSSPNHATYFKP